MNEYVGRLLLGLGIGGALAFGLYLRLIFGFFPVTVALICACIGVVTTVAVISFNRQVAKGRLSERRTITTILICALAAIAFAVAAAVLQMGVAQAVANSLRVDPEEYARMGTFSTRLLAPSFFVVLHCVLCFGLRFVGLFRKSQSILWGGIVLSAPTFYILIAYANSPI